ncbi:MAG: iron ABC transporter permease, partial [Proteobacteria bacterium]
MSKLRSYFSLQALLFLTATLIVFCLCVYPFINLFLKVVFQNGEFSLKIFTDLLQVKAVHRAFLNTVKVCISITLASLVIAVPLAWLLSRWDFPFAHKFRSWLSLPYAIPPYVGAIAWIYLANPTTGLINHVLGGPVLNIYSLTGLIFVETSFLYTFVFLSTLSSLDRMDSSLEEAARLSGASPFRVFKDVTLPIIRPTLISGALLVFLAAIASFGVPALIGGPARVYLVTTQIYTFMRMGSMGALLKAAGLSFLLMIIAILLLVAAHFASNRKRMQTVGGKTARPSTYELGKLRWPAFILVCLFGTVVFILPVGGIILSSLSLTQGEVGFANITLANWHRIL